MHACFEGDADSRRILQRDPTTSVNGLRLGVEERMLLSGCLLRCEPLQGGCRWIRRITNLYELCVRRDIDAEWRAEDLIDFASGKPRFPILQSIGRHFGFVNLKSARVQYELFRLVRGLFDAEDRSPLDGVLLEDDFQIQIQMPNPYELGIRIGMNVVSDTGKQAVLFLFRTGCHEDGCRNYRGVNVCQFPIIADDGTPG